MKATHNLNRNISLGIIIIFLIPFYGWSQPKRVKPPKRISKIESVDQFVKHSFELYNKVFVYDSLTRAGVEVPSEIEDALVERAEQDVDSLWQALPVVLEDMTNGKENILKKGKATLNLNKSKRALKYCIKTVKAYFVGSNEDEEESE